MSDRLSEYTTASVGDLSTFEALPTETRSLVERIVAYRLATAREQGFKAGQASCGMHTESCAVHYPADGDCNCEFGRLRRATPDQQEDAPND